MLFTLLKDSGEQSKKIGTDADRAGRETVLPSELEKESHVRAVQQPAINL